MLSIRERYTRKSDEDLKTLIIEINQNFPNFGIREVVAHLKNQDPPILLHRLQCQKLLFEIDLVGCSICWAQTIKRRQYSVPTPNSLWHIDSHHALIR